MTDATIPDLHETFLDRAATALREDSRIVGVAVGGSYLSGDMDEFSDLDLVIAVEPGAYESMLNERRAVAGTLGPLLAAFTGEHVGEPRLLICLYGPPLLHVDLKFVRLEDAATRVEDPAILWDRDGRFEATLRIGAARFPEPDPQWIEDRLWIWVHYGAVKIGRGELFEAVDFLAYLRNTVLGPLALSAAGARPSGVRRIEFAAPDVVTRMQATIADYDPRSCVSALLATVDLYRDLRSRLDHDIDCSPEAEDAAMAYLEEIRERVGTNLFREA